MPVASVTSSQFQQAFGMLSDQARQAPVVITKHGRPSLVVVAVEEWERLKRRDRKAGLTVELSDEWIEAIENAMVSDERADIDNELT